jgi:hypothetical protein
VGAPEIPAAFESAGIRVQRFGEVRHVARTAIVSLMAAAALGLIIMTPLPFPIRFFVAAFAGLAGIAALVSVAGTLAMSVAALLAIPRSGLLFVTLDGLVLHRAGWPLHLPFYVIKRDHVDEEGVVLETDAGDVVRIELVDPLDRARYPEAAAEARRRAAEPPPPRRYPLAVAAEFGRRGRSIEAWRAAIVGPREGGYRGLRVEDDDALSVLEDLRAPTELRIGAALALRGTTDPALGRRVRVAVYACPDDDLRAALSEAAYGDLDAGTLDRALS